MGIGKLLFDMWFSPSLGLQCGGFKPSLQATANREVRTAQALQRTSDLGTHLGHEVAFPIGGRKILIGRFGGWIRRENMGYWDTRGHGFYRVHAESFTEKGHTFPIPETKAILVRVVDNPRDGKREVRIVTEPAEGAVAQVHDRQPILIDKKAPVTV